MQDVVKNKLVEYVKSNGIKMLHISRETDIPDYVLCKFKHGKIGLNEACLNRLDNYLRSKNA